MQQKGMQMKNKHSSRGKLKKYSPVKYLGLKPQIPKLVNQISHGMKIKSIPNNPKKKDLKCKWNCSLLWNEKIKGTMTEKKRMNK